MNKNWDIRFFTKTGYPSDLISNDRQFNVCRAVDPHSFYADPDPALQNL